MEEVMKNEHLDQIVKHVEKAKKKHPEFCNGFLATDGSHKNSLGVLRKLREMNPCAQTILGEEVIEIYDAYHDGDKLHAIDECFDAIAVLVRMVEMIEAELEKKDAN